MAEVILTHAYDHIAPAPYKFLGLRENVVTYPGGHTQPGGTCDHCGTGIKYECLFEAADGSTFVVGTTCVEKSLSDPQWTTKTAQAKRQLLREKAAAKRAQELQAKRQAERTDNYGLTVQEAAAINARISRNAALEAAKKRGLAWVDQVAVLRDGKGGFRDSIAAGLERGELPSGRGLYITLEILAKQVARGGSKAYHAEFDRLETLFKEASAND